MKITNLITTFAIILTAQQLTTTNANTTDNNNNNSNINCDRKFKCLTDYQPVCGSDAKTYSNQCVFENAVCLERKSGTKPTATNQQPLTKLFDGACDMANNRFCNMYCTMDYTPVCGSDGNTYSNSCMLQSAKCKRVALYQVHDGPCAVKAAAPSADNLKQETATSTSTNNNNVNNNNNDCNMNCTNFHVSVCGSDGVTYVNQCVLDQTACKTKTAITKVHNGDCSLATAAPPVCNEGCPRDFRPVCGSNGITYNNKCLLDVAACKTKVSILVAHDGECTSTPTSKPQECSESCTREYRPVCGSNAVTYSNKCTLSVAACKSKSTVITLAYVGKCRDTTSCSTLTCGQHSTCKMDDATGKAYCADTCSTGRCAADEVCSLHQVQCVMAPCPPIAVCTKL